MRGEHAREQRRLEGGQDFLGLHFAALEDPVGPGVERGHLLVHAACHVADEDADEQPLQFVLAADLLEQVHAVDLGSVVDQDRVEGKTVEDVQPLRAVFDALDPVARVLQFLFPTLDRRILHGDDKDALGSGQSFTRRESFRCGAHHDLARVVARRQVGGRLVPLE